MSIPWRLLALIVAVLSVGITAYLMFGNAEPSGRADASDQALVAEGKVVYLERCASCHGRELEGQPGWRQRLPDGGFPAPPHDEAGHTWHHPDTVLFAYTKLGGAAAAPADFKSNMPAFADILSDREIWTALAFVKSRWPEEILARQDRLNRRPE